MKKHLVIYSIISFCFSPLYAEAITLFSFFKKKPSSLLEELNNPKLNIKSALSPFIGFHLGQAVLSPLVEDNEKETEFLFTYDPPNGDGRKKGKFILSFKTKNSSDQNDNYQHFIYWDSDVENPQFNEETAKAIFNKVYEEVYGVDLDWLIEHEMIPKIIAYGNKYKFSPHELQRTFNFEALIFKDKEEDLKLLVSQTMRQPPDQEEVKSGKSEPFSLPSKMNPLMRKIFLESLSREEPFSLSQYLKVLTIKEIVLLFNTPDKIRTVDMNLITPEMAIHLLTSSRKWRNAITPTQVKQLDVRANGIQYIFAPVFKHFMKVSGSKDIDIDTLSDEQIMSMDRDTFLRDVFLAGDLYIQGYIPPYAEAFMEARQKSVGEKGRETVMSGALSDREYSIISKMLGFDMNFENMTAQQRRELFKKEIVLMTNHRKQIDIINELTTVMPCGESFQ